MAPVIRPPNTIQPPPAPYSRARVVAFFLSVIVAGLAAGAVVGLVAMRVFYP